MLFNQSTRFKVLCIYGVGGHAETIVRLRFGAFFLYIRAVSDRADLSVISHNLYNIDSLLERKKLEQKISSSSLAETGPVMQSVPYCIEQL